MGFDPNSCKMTPEEKAEESRARAEGTRNRQAFIDSLLDLINRFRNRFGRSARSSGVPDFLPGGSATRGPNPGSLSRQARGAQDCPALVDSRRDRPAAVIYNPFGCETITRSDNSRCHSDDGCFSRVRNERF